MFLSKTLRLVQSFVMKKKPGKAVKVAVLTYYERIPWQSLSLAERQRFLDRGKLTSSDLAALKELGIDEPRNGKSPESTATRVKSS
jgi:hypothetical protein